MHLNVTIDSLNQTHIDNIKTNNQKLITAIQQYENSMAYQWYIHEDHKWKEKYLATCATMFNQYLKHKNQTSH